MDQFPTLTHPEPTYYLHGNAGFFTIAVQDPNNSSWDKYQFTFHSYPLAELNKRIDEWTTRSKHEHKNIYISQCISNQPNRKRTSFHSVNQLFVELKINKSLRLHVRCMDSEDIISAIHRICEENNIPHPSFIIRNDTDYQLRWLVNTLSANALAIWECTQRYLEILFIELGANLKNNYVSRYLPICGSYDYKNDSVVEVIAINYEKNKPARYEFKQLSETLLPYSLDEAKEYNAKQSQITAEYSKNRKQMTRERNKRKFVQGCIESLAKEIQIKDLTAEKLYQHIRDTIGKRKVSLDYCKDMLVRWENMQAREKYSTQILSKKMLAWTRYQDILRLAKYRTTNTFLEEGLREQLFLYACNFYALSEIDNVNKEFEAEFLSIAEILVPDWDQKKSISAIRNIFDRLKEAKKGQQRTFNDQKYVSLLTPTNNTLIDMFAISEMEMQTTTDSGEYLLETIINDAEKSRRKPIHQNRRRRNKGIQERTVYEAKRKQETEDKATRAREMKANGFSTKQIAQALNMSVPGIYKLLKFILV